MATETHFLLFFFWWGINYWKDEINSGVKVRFFNSPGSQTVLVRYCDIIEYFSSSSKIVRPMIPRDARCAKHCEIMWSAVCTVALYSQLGKEARPYLYLEEQKPPIPGSKRLSLPKLSWAYSFLKVWYSLWK